MDSFPMVIAIRLLLVVQTVSTITSEIRQPLYVLSLLPYSDSNGKYGWDHGLELLIAARVAVSHINQRTDILPGYEIRLIERASDACGKTTITKGLLNLVENALQFENDKQPIAVVGLACSTVVATVSPIAGRYDILQMAMATSTKLRDKERFPHLWRFHSSSDQYVEAIIKYMEFNGWRRVGIVSDGVGVFYQALANNFRDIVKRRNFTITLDEGISSSSSMISSVIERIRNNGVRIIFAPTTLPQSIELLCQATKYNLIWPGYVWIFQSRLYHQFFQGPNTSRCMGVSEDSWIRSLENVIFINFRLKGRNDNVTMVSGKTYSQYRADYENEYINLQRQYNGSGIEFHSYDNTLYSNPVYDELWGLALALNSSLDEFENNSLELKDYRKNIRLITKIVEHHLRNLSFPGTRGRVYFNEFNEAPVDVYIQQVRNQTNLEIAVYKDGQLTDLNYSSDNPGDNFLKKYNYTNSLYSISLYIIAVILLLFTSALLSISLVLRKEPELLAVNPYLNGLIFLGCYQLLLISVVSASQNYVKLSSWIYIVFCYLEFRFGYSGVYLIAATVLARLIRVYRIFTHFGKLSRFWGNGYLFCIIFVMSYLPELLAGVSFSIDAVKVAYSEEYLLDENPPVVALTPVCHSEGWLISAAFMINLMYLTILVSLLLAFAILTRKVNKCDFKDTKKVTAFVVAFTFVTVILTIVIEVFKSTDHNIAGIVQSYMYQVIALLSLVCLIAPKSLPAFYYCILKRRPKRKSHNADDHIRKDSITEVLINLINKTSST